MGARDISTVVASAGAGKTYRIVEEIAREVEVRDPEGIVATTFTIKAADELIERSRARLFEAGRPQEAVRLLGARFGTVNAICGQIVAENAISLGRSPLAEVIGEDSVGHVFAIAADAMGFFEPRFGGDGDASDWRGVVRRIIELARANGIAAEGLEASASRSVETFLELLPEAAEDGDRLDADLAAAVSDAVAAVPVEVSATAKGCVALLRQVHAAHRRGERLSWPDWARLTKVKCAKKDGQALMDAVEAVCRAAGRHPSHPRLRSECERFILTVFACAAEALSAYQSYKGSRGLLDFIDQETLALEALRDAAISARLSERIGRLFVDEFQDSSPLQIAIFSAMAPLVDASTWVGDPKQAIYGFRNADSALTQAAFAGVAAEGAQPHDVLARSYRSRDGIVRFVNEAFAPALTSMGLNPSEHAFSGTARSELGFERPPFSVWWLDGKLDLQYAALAAAIRDVVAPDTTWRAGLKPEGVRPMRAGDVAVLCRSRSDIAKVADALNRLGVEVAVERAGLGRTPHVELVMAAYRWVADPSDRLALAELARFLADDPDSDAWLQAVAEDEQTAALRQAVPIAPALEALRGRILSLTPADLVDAIVLLPEVTRRVESWGDVGARFDDLEALRGFARSYEAGCSGAGVPATPSGLVLALASEEPSRPPSLRDDAVKVMTYHAAKGLEWPCVVLTGLGREPKPRLFEPVAEAVGEVDWRNPLAGRWIRYWPWPYASQAKDVHLDASALASPLGVEAAARARDEEARLLYVGVTRARDQVVFAPPAKGALGWLSVLDGGAVHVELPRSASDRILVGGAAFDAEVALLSADEQTAARDVRPSFVRVLRFPVDRAPLHRRPSDAVGGAWRVAERIQLGPRLPMVGQPDMRLLGEAVHAIAAADNRGMAPEARLARASAILGRWGVHQVAPVDLLDACDRLADVIARRWPSAKVLREVPVSARLGDQLVSGRIDMLVEHAAGFAILDHKSFPGSQSTWDERAEEYGPQLGLYAEALERARPGRATELFVHMPVVGALLRLDRVEVVA